MINTGTSRNLDLIGKQRSPKPEVKVK